jgi:hypothetical protein
VGYHPGMFAKSRGRLLTPMLLFMAALACSSTPSILTAERTRLAAESPQVRPTTTARPTRGVTPTASATAMPAASPTNYRIGPSGFPADVDPLTALKAESPALLERRPVGLEYANFPVGIRPQAGLSFADLVFEHASGQGTTRFLAFFFGRDAPSAGPITSGQWVDGDLVRLYGGILGVNGAIPEVAQTLEDQLGSAMYNASPSLCPGLCPSGKSVGSEVFADTAALSRRDNALTNGSMVPELEGYLFDGQLPPGGLAATHLTVTYARSNDVGWTYDADLGAYLRSQDLGDGHLVPATDSLTGDQLAFPNVIVLQTTHEAVHANLLDVHLWFEPMHPILLLRGGRVYHGFWSITDRDSPLQWLDANGLPLALAPGPTWVEIVKLDSRIAQTEPGLWQVDFSP